MQRAKPEEAGSIVLTEDIVVGGADRNSVRGQERRALHAKALDAKEQRDLNAMFAAYQAAVEERTNMETAMNAFAGYAVEKARDSEAHPITAIRDVALAAIQLAKDVALAKGGSDA